MKRNMVAIVQARLSSTRFPGKVMQPLGSKTVLDHVVDRLRDCQRIDQVVVATTRDEGDDALEEFCRARGFDCYRGDREDVLGRFYDGAVRYRATDIVRVTSDNPLVDPDVVNDTIGLYLGGQADYAANNLKKSFPHGLDVEVISFKALEESYHEAKDSFEREHVTQFVRHRPERYTLVNHAASGDWHAIRVTLDEDTDYQLIRLVMKILGENVRFDSLHALFDEYPALKNVNAGARDRHAGYNAREKIV